MDATEVVYTSRKPPAAWTDELAARGISGEVDGEIELFSGTAAEAARRYPKNLNVAATMALAGLGMTATRVRVVADPAATGNTHELQVRGPAGTFSMRLENRPSPVNPKTSWLTALSVVAAIQRFYAPIQVG
jgi:aspartate dehydrogenase